MFFLRDIHRKLDAILARLGRVEKDREAMTQDLQNLADQVKQNTDAEQSAVALLTSLADKLHAAADDPAAIRDLATQLKSSSDALAAAIVANTPTQ
jgi:chromosome segregation ATPase